MAGPNDNEAETRPKPDVHELEDVVRVVGLIFTNTFLYGARHGVTLKAADDCFNIISQVLQKYGELSFSVSEGILTVNEIIIEQKNPLMRAFAARLPDLDISSFGLKEGLIREKFDKLLEIMNSKPEQLKEVGGFAQAVIAAQLENVRTRVVTYKAVSEDEVIVSKKAIDDAMAGEGASVEEMVAFLGGGTAAEPQGGDAIERQEPKRAREERAIQQMAADPGHLGDVIMKAAETGSKEQSPKNQQEVTAMVVSCLKKVYDVLSKNPVVKTQKGKKSLGRTLMMLEKDILARMEAKAAGGGAGAAEHAKSISEAVEAMNDEMEIETLATEYMKKRNAIDTNERRILRFIRSKGLDKVSDTELRRRLEEGGLNAEQWQELLAKSGVGPGGRVAGLDGITGATAEGHLAILLANMGDLVASRAAGGGGGASPEQNAQQISSMVTAVDAEIRDLVVKTEQKINDLVQVIKAEEEDLPAATEAGKDGAAGQAKSLVPRKRLMMLLAEIVQELCQPLSVINCSIEMLKSKCLGEISDGQLEILGLASTSGERVKLLIDKLVELSGLPSTMTPDAAIQSSLYKQEP